MGREKEWRTKRWSELTFLVIRDLRVGWVLEVLYLRSDVLELENCSSKMSEQSASLVS